MAETTTMLPSEQFLRHNISTIWEAKDIRVCFLATTVQISAAIADIYAAEYDLDYWQRPTVNIATIGGTFDIVTNTLTIPPIVWDITAPGTGLNYNQLFFIIGGTATPHDTTGLMVGLVTQANRTIVPANTTYPVDIDLSVWGLG